MQFTITKSIEAKDIADLLCGALEGGSNYWYMIEKKIEPTKWLRSEAVWFATKEEAQKSKIKHYLHYYPLNPGGGLIFSDKERDNKETFLLNSTAIQIGLQKMAEEYPKHFADFQSGDYDGNTSDIFLQLCLFKEVLYS